MGSPTVFPKNDPRRRILLNTCLVLCCGFFVVELIVFLFVQELLGADRGFVHQSLHRRFALFSMGRSNLAIYGGVGQGLDRFVALQIVGQSNRRESRA